MTTLRCPRMLTNDVREYGPSCGDYDVDHTPSDAEENLGQVLIDACRRNSWRLFVCLWPDGLSHHHAIPVLACCD
jgi:hypothetical protein